MPHRAIGASLLAQPLPLSVPAPASGQDTDFFDLSLQERVQVEATSASKRAQPLSAAAAAIFVISAQDPRRSGVTNIPDALWMVPGVQVARIDGNEETGAQLSLTPPHSVLVERDRARGNRFRSAPWPAHST